VARRDARPIPVPGADARLAARYDAAEMNTRIALVGLFFVLGLCAVLARMYYLQVVSTEHWTQLANNNFVREIEIPPDRGLIYDARGELVAENRPAYEVWVTPQVFDGTEEQIESLRTILDLPDDAVTRLRTRLEAGARAEVVVARDVSRDQIARVLAARDALAGVYVRVSARRYYAYDALGAHALGFVNEVRDDELERLGDYGYRVGDYIGRTGLERAFEPLLRGAAGFERQVVNAQGVEQPEDVRRSLLGDYTRVDPIAGRSLHLTLDMRVQAIVDDAAASSVSGGIAVIDPRDGSILAMFSKPGFNPNAWSGRLSEHEQRLSDNNPFHPMLDKSVQSYFPGSTYKVITALAALEEGLVDTEHVVECPGYLEYGDRRFHCWNRSGHGPQTLRQALAESCDVYFYEVGLQLGIDRLATYAQEFGFGERPGLGFNGDSAGVVPTREWHETHSPGGFQYGFTVNTSVGQGDTRVSPLQLALAYAALANGGTLYYPRIVDRITNAWGEVVFEYPRRVRRQLPFARENVAEVVAGLSDVLNSPDGTAYDQRLDYIHVAGKTGTAQVRSLATVRLEGGQVVFRDRDHAWFVAFAPVENPLVVVSVFLEHGGQGSSAAAPVAIRIIDRYFREILGWNAEIELAEQRGDDRALRALYLPQPTARRARADARVVWDEWAAPAADGSGATP
jgi:penicillin-binding protein 2